MKIDLTSTEAAELLHVSAATVKRWADDGLIPTLRTLGGHRRFRRTDVLTMADKLLSQNVKGELLEVLLAREHVLAVQAALLAKRAQLGAWSDVAGVCLRALNDVARQTREGSEPYLSIRISHRLLEAALSRCADEMPTRAGGPTALFAAVEDERSTVELALSRVCVRDLGWRALAAGPATASELVTFVTTQPPAALILFAGIARSRPGLQAVLSTVLPACERSSVAVALTGGAPWPELAGAARVVRSAAELQDWIRRLEQGRSVG
jgi:excisionase family DNA binding protein